MFLSLLLFVSENQSERVFKNIFVSSFSLSSFILDYGEEAVMTRPLMDHLILHILGLLIIIVPQVHSHHDSLGPRGIIGYRWVLLSWSPYGMWSMSVLWTWERISCRTSILDNDDNIRRSESLSFTEKVMKSETINSRINHSKVKDCNRLAVLSVVPLKTVCLTHHFHVHSSIFSSFYLLLFIIS